MLSTCIFASTDFPIQQSFHQATFSLLILNYLRSMVLPSKILRCLNNKTCQSLNQLITWSLEQKCMSAGLYKFLSVTKSQLSSQSQHFVLPTLKWMINGKTINKKTTAICTWNTEWTHTFKHLVCMSRFFFFLMSLSNSFCQI